MSSNHCSSDCKLAKNRCDTEMRFHEAKYVWTISNFDFHEKLWSNLLSPTFSAATNYQLKWFLQLEPNVESEIKDFARLHICLKTDGISDDISNALYVKSSLSFLDRKQKEICCNGYSNINDAAITKFSFSPSKEIAQEYDWHKNDFFRNNLLSNQKLTIICRIIFTNTVHSCNFASLYPNVPVCNLVENLGMLLENGNLADIVLCVKDKKKEFPAHKNILAARSSVFAAMFKHNFKENETNRIEIKDMHEDVVAEMLRYIYTGKCENSGKLADGLLAAANKYDLGRLKMICAEELYKTLSVENAASILALADLHCVTELKAETMKFIIARYSEVTNSTTWNKINQWNQQLMFEVLHAVVGSI